MIIQELEAEVDAHESCAADIRRNDELEEKREKLEDELRYYQARFKELTRQIEAHSAKGRERCDPHPPHRRARARQARRGARPGAAPRSREREYRAGRPDRSRFHPYWGSLLKEATEKSSFGDQVEEYACLYTSRVSNFLAYSPLQYFRSPRDLMPHELYSTDAILSPPL